MISFYCGSFQFRITLLRFQTFDIVIEVEQRLTGLDSRNTRESVEVEPTANFFNGIQFDATDKQTIGDVEYDVKSSDVSGMRRR